MEAPRLVASDVDGTLLDHTEHVTGRTAAVVARTVAAGVPFVLVTGRPPRWIGPVVKELPMVRYAVCANGGVIYDAHADRVLSARTIAPADLVDLAAGATEALPECRLAAERIGTSSAGEPFVVEPGYLHAWTDASDVTAARAELLSRPAAKLLVRDRGLTSEEMVAALAPVIGGAADLTYSTSGGLVEISPTGVTKATGLAELAQQHEVTAPEIVAFGDMPNDLEMLRWAGHGVAMGNAHPDLLAVADEITAANADDGLALVLERWF